MHLPPVYTRVVSWGTQVKMCIIIWDQMHCNIFVINNHHHHTLKRILPLTLTLKQDFFFWNNPYARFIEFELKNENNPFSTKQKIFIPSSLFLWKTTFFSFLQSWICTRCKLENSLKDQWGFLCICDDFTFWNYKLTSSHFENGCNVIAYFLLGRVKMHILMLVCR